MLTTIGLVEIRELLAALLVPGSRGPARIPPALRRLALQVCHRHEDVDDTVQAVLGDLLQRSRSGQRGGVQELLKLDARTLGAALRRRLTQIHAERQEHWKVVKALREHVAVALAEPGDPPAAMPSSIIVDGRIRSESVRAAVAWMLAQEDAPPRSVAAIAARLFDEYISGALFHEEQARGVGATEEETIAALDAPSVAMRARQDLPADHLTTLRQRVEGASLAVIAQRQGVAVSTACARVQQAVEALGAWAAGASIDAASLGPALMLMAR